MKTIKSLFVSAMCGIFSFIFVFFIVPTFMIGAPDVIWISLCIVLPVVLAVSVFKMYHIRPVFVIVGMLVQFALLVLLSNPVSHKWGMSLQGLGAFEYISLFVYPIVITVLSWVLLKIFIRNKKRSDFTPLL